MGTAFRVLGNFLRPMIASLKPVLKSAATAVGKQALSSAGGFVGDLASGANWKEAAEDRLREAGTSLGDRLSKRMQQMGSGRNKSMHDAVKLYSFFPPTGVTGRVGKRKTAPRRGRLVAGKRRTTTGRKGIKKKKKTAAATGKRSVGRKRKVGGGKKRKTGIRRSSRRRQLPQQQQHGSGFLF